MSNFRTDLAAVAAVLFLFPMLQDFKEALVVVKPPNMGFEKELLVLVHSLMQGQHLLGRACRRMGPPKAFPLKGRPILKMQVGTPQELEPAGQKPFFDRVENQVQIEVVGFQRLRISKDRKIHARQGIPTVEETDQGQAEQEHFMEGKLIQTLLQTNDQVGKLCREFQALEPGLHLQIPLELTSNRFRVLQGIAGEDVGLEGTGMEKANIPP